MTAGDGAYRVRPAVADDAEQLAEAHVVAWRQAYHGIVPARILAGLSVEERRRSFATRLADPPHRAATFAVVGPGEAVIGFGACGTRRSGPRRYRGEFQAVYLTRAGWGRGLGRALMRSMAGWLDAQGLAPALVWVLRDNHRARAFYERLGGLPLAESSFRIQGVRLREVSYGWPSLDPLLDGGRTPGEPAALRLPALPGRGAGAWLER